MLMRQDISKQRGQVGRLLIGTTTLAVLGATATLVPASIAAAGTQPAEQSEASTSETPAVAETVPGVMVYTSTHEDGREGSATSAGGKKREVHRIVIRRDGDGKDAMVAVSPTEDKDAMIRRLEVRTLGSLSRDDVLATLKEQGVSGKKAEAIADRLEAKRRDQIRTVLAPMPPMPPMPTMPPVPHRSVASTVSHSVTLGKCSDGKPVAPIVDRDESDGNKRSHVTLYSCSNAAASKAARVSALKKAREAFAEGERGRGLSDAMRAKVGADLDRAIADIERSGQ